MGNRQRQLQKNSNGKTHLSIFSLQDKHFFQVKLERANLKHKLIENREVILCQLEGLISIKAGRGKKSITAST